MESRRLNLRLPLTTKQYLERPSSERPSSRTDRLVEASFSSDIPQESNTPRSIQSSSYKTLSSTTKLKDIIQKTSNRLKAYHSNPSTSNSPVNPPEKSLELSKLRREVRILEMEKKELEEENKRLQNSLQGYKDASTMSEDPSSSLLRFSKMLVAKAKEDAVWNGVFKDIFGNDEAFMAKVNNESGSCLSLGLIQFLFEIEEKRGHEGLKKNLKPMVSDDSIAKIFRESKNIAETISAQRIKIERVYESVKETVGISRGASGTPILSRPMSSGSARSSDSKN